MPGTIATVAAQQGVTVEHAKAVMRARKSYRDGRMWRNRAAARTKERNPAARAYKVSPRVYAGEGELDALLREAGMTVLEFCGFCGIAHGTFYRWYGHPMHLMPVQLLRHYVWALNMAKYLKAMGWDPEDFKAKGLPRAQGGNYPRTTAQGAAVAEPTSVNCPVHGHQKALGGECPKC